MLLELPSEVLLVLLPGQVLILAQETLLRHRQPEPSVVHVCTITSLEVDLYTTIALQPSVLAATTSAQGTFHVSALGP